jgi:hypothetical protein
VIIDGYRQRSLLKSWLGSDGKVWVIIIYPAFIFSDRHALDVDTCANSGYVWE